MGVDDIRLGFVWYVVFLLSLVLHEAAHAFVSSKLGDPTAEEGGQVSLNPIPHIQRKLLEQLLSRFYHTFLPDGCLVGPVFHKMSNGPENIQKNLQWLQSQDQLQTWHW